LEPDPKRAETVTNLVPFYEAFGVWPGDKMDRADPVQVGIW
jgi:predicted metalloendopeptidase